MDVPPGASGLVAKMKHPWVIIAALVGYVLWSRNRTLYVSTHGLSTAPSADYANDSAVSANVSAAGAMVPTLTSDLIIPESLGWLV